MADATVLAGADWQARLDDLAARHRVPGFQVGLLTPEGGVRVPAAGLADPDHGPEITVRHLLTHTSGIDGDLLRFAAHLRDDVGLTGERILSAESARLGRHGGRAPQRQHQRPARRTGLVPRTGVALCVLTARNGARREFALLTHLGVDHVFAGRLFGRTG
ncbi:serine hydrolase [Actinosynnema sp. NPDC047251]|uniref:Uncharacterized protein n=1 Tax=Saccharothrix espanaensis (strain ATCC 51144 / DSM 44229 / JCM 9112 / NBRC 15066 / NRRL 15764) TaxID=1179773 RepID=K0JRA4_SACES|nr:serine hydrolase [Saccharothrix espanaensis]CCH30095.1 hypothetical protein BN6_27830 [Saccharothrix espanaensis DSM 44229]